MPENQKEIQRNWLGELNHCLEKTKENPLFRISHKKKLVKIPIRENLQEKTCEKPHKNYDKTREPNIWLDISNKNGQNNEKVEKNDKIYHKNKDIFEKSLLIFPEKLYKFIKKS